MDDLWPDLDKIEPANAPVTILRQQAALLSEKMKNLIEGQVTAASAPPPRQFGYNFYIACPSLNYRYQPFYLAHDVDMYPVYLHLDTDIDAEINPLNPLSDLDVELTPVNPLSLMLDLTAHSEDQLKDILRKIFASQKVKKVIQALLAQLQTGYTQSPQA
jgi:hypothetical protein